MARPSYQDEQDLMYQILPAVKTRRITLESSAENNIILTLDFYIDDYLTPEGVGLIMSLPNSFDQDAEMPKEEEFMKALKLGIIISHRGRDEFLKEKFRRIAVFRTAVDTGDEFNERLGVHDTMEQFLSFLGNERQQGDGAFIIRKEPARQSKPGQFFEDYSSHFRRTDIGSNQPVYRIPYTVTIGNDPELSQELISGDTNELVVHAFTYLDFSLLGLDLDTEDVRYLNLLHGKRLKETIIRRGELNPYTMVLRDNKGTPYGGPYHVMPSPRGDGIRFMKGFKHGADQGPILWTEDPSKYLTVINVPNTKIQDFRKLERTSDLFTPLMLPSLMQSTKLGKFLKDKRDKNFNAQLFVHQDPESGIVDYKFIIDQKQVLEKGSRLGYLFKHLPNFTKYEMLRPKINLKLINVKVLRRRITDRNLGIDSLGFGARDLFDRNEPEFVVAEASQELSLTAREATMRAAGISAQNVVGSAFDLIDTVIDERSPSYLITTSDNVRTATGEIVDIPVPEVYDNLLAAVSELKSYLRSSPGAPPPIKGGMPLFPFYRVLQGRDMSLLNTVDGTYQYGLELEYEDPMFEYYERVLDRLREQTLKLKEYYRLASIPVVTQQSFRGTSRTGHMIGDSRENIGKIGNYNSIAKKFESNFITEARERFDFAAMEAAYFELLGLVYANAEFTISQGQQGDALKRIGSVNEEGGIVDKQLRDLDIQFLIQPDNSRPEQILQVLKGFQDLVVEAGKILGTPSEGDQSKSSSEFGGRRNFTSGKNRTIKIKRFFTGHGDSEASSYFIDCTQRKLDSVDLLGGAQRYQTEQERQRARRAAGAALAAATAPAIREEFLDQISIAGVEFTAPEDRFQNVFSGPRQLGDYVGAVPTVPTVPTPPRPPTFPGIGFPRMSPTWFAGRFNMESSKVGNSLDNYLGDSAVLTWNSYRGNSGQTNSHFRWGDSSTRPGSFVIRLGPGPGSDTSTAGSNVASGVMGVNQALDLVNMSRQFVQENALQTQFNWDTDNTAANDPGGGAGGGANPFEQPANAFSAVASRMAESMASVTNVSVTVPSGPAFEAAIRAFGGEEMCGIGNEPEIPPGFPIDFRATLREAGSAHHSFLDLSNVFRQDLGNVINTDTLMSNLQQGVPSFPGAAPMSGLPSTGPSGPVINAGITDAAAIVERLDGFAWDADGNINLGRANYSAVGQNEAAAGNVPPGQYRVRYAQDPSTEAGNQTRAESRAYRGGADGGNNSSTRPAQGQAHFEISGAPARTPDEPVEDEVQAEQEAAAQAAAAGALAGQLRTASTRADSTAAAITTRTRVWGFNRARRPSGPAGSSGGGPFGGRGGL